MQDQVYLISNFLNDILIQMYIILSLLGVIFDNLINFILRCRPRSLTLYSLFSFSYYMKSSIFILLYYKFILQNMIFFMLNKYLLQEHMYFMFSIFLFFLSYMKVILVMLNHIFFMIFINLSFY